MKEIRGNSGANIKIGIASFKDSMALKNAITRELAKANLDLNSLFKNKKVSEILKTSVEDLDFDKIKEALLSVDCSESVQEALFACMIKCTYNGSKITQDTFEDEFARGDYYLISLEVVKANLLPFYKGVASALPQRITPQQPQTVKESQPSA